MKEVKMPTSDSWHDALIESLKDPEEAAAYIEVALELEEKDPQPDMLRLTLKDVVEARVRLNNLSEEAKRSYEKLDKILSETGGAEIYGLVELLDVLGFRIAVREAMP
jgi:DNA-binding phage protein